MRGGGGSHLRLQQSWEEEEREEREGARQPQEGEEGWGEQQQPRVGEEREEEQQRGWAGKRHASGRCVYIVCISCMDFLITERHLYYSACRTIATAMTISNSNGNGSCDSNSNGTIINSYRYCY
jgi:hypothetical protein